MPHVIGVSDVFRFQYCKCYEPAISAFGSQSDMSFYEDLLFSFSTTIDTYDHDSNTLSTVHISLYYRVYMCIGIYIHINYNFTLYIYSGVTTYNK